MIAVSVNMIWIGVSMMPNLIRAVLRMPSLRITSIIAKVRMSRLVQNGMVMRKSQTSRVRSGLVEMK